MRLIIGGYAQGKKDYVLSRYHIQEDAVWDGAIPEDTAPGGGTVAIDHFHKWVRNRMLGGGCPEEEIMAFLERCGDCVIICDEIGNGIVPTDPFEREYRERVGRILVRLAEKAEEVERVICGIGQKIK
ncbi:MAG: bifunctional adenosylcobinamide kinase/adenosylcobinamide-phosphate guanylyltransferase [Lachnospiraceae bacterium]|nr:bifunctional adenosylcobinamide kinase/adenosylcobinamide-phosphate guanylyltransferase [Butyrivibrio sp.]MCM1344874.1 bifunctional adenosylcobinamide kinase/adenosylcobinamide-phosphate guanylyltransferase [Muribaculaceae bacterium]MCM1411200.1 bifunctional adenosylcobinamide kinase/adenosylcobinamide-phosphate guanylyltransferase [Lachnospiraceae bacterium]